jgi:hypothetical protein
VSEYQAKPRTVSAEQWDGGQDVTALEEVAGPVNVQIVPGGVQVLVADGSWVTLLPGWWVTASDDDVTASSDYAFREAYEPVP